jgi:hypothetical protein
LVLGSNGVHVYLTPLDPKAVSQIRVNGHVCTDMKEVKLRPNDRICIGPAALFIYKNKQKEAEESSMVDTEDDPITHEFASEEVIEAENVGQKEEKEAMKKMQAEQAK